MNKKTISGVMDVSPAVRASIQCLKHEHESLYKLVQEIRSSSSQVQKAQYALVQESLASCGLVSELSTELVDSLTERCTQLEPSLIEIDETLLRYAMSLFVQSELLNRWSHCMSSVHLKDVKDLQKATSSMRKEVFQLLSQNEDLSYPEHGIYASLFAKFGLNWREQFSEDQNGLLDFYDQLVKPTHIEYLTKRKLGADWKKLNLHQGECPCLPIENELDDTVFGNDIKLYIPVKNGALVVYGTLPMDCQESLRDHAMMSQKCEALSHYFSKPILFGRFGELSMSDSSKSPGEVFARTIINQLKSAIEENKENIPPDGAIVSDSESDVSYDSDDESEGSISSDDESFIAESSEDEAMDVSPQVSERALRSGGRGASASTAVGGSIGSRVRRRNKQLQKSTPAKANAKSKPTAKPVGKGKSAKRARSQDSVVSLPSSKRRKTSKSAAAHYDQFLEKSLKVLTPFQVLTQSPESLSDAIGQRFESYQGARELRRSALAHRFKSYDTPQQYDLLLSLVLNDKPELALELFETLPHETKSIMMKTFPIPVKTFMEAVFEQIKTVAIMADEDTGSSDLEFLAAKIFNKKETPNSVRAMAWAKAELHKLAETSEESSAYNSIKERLTLLSKIPYGESLPMEVSQTSTLGKRQAFFRQLHDNLDSATYGQIELKERLFEKVAQLVMNPQAKGKCILLLGPPGTGKTTIARHGLAKSLGRYFAEIPLAGVEDSSLLKGNGPVWEGAKPGEIMRHMVQSGSENMIMFFDEVDKIGKGHHGESVRQNLVQITDFTQNDAFQDLFLTEAPIDISKCLFIFTANTLSTIPGPLLDRIEVIQVKPQSLKEKVQIGIRYQLPDILKQNGFKPGDIVLDDDVMGYIISKFPWEAGSRSQKRLLENIIQSLTLTRVLTEQHFQWFPDSVGDRLSVHVKGNDFHIPRFRVTKELVDECTKRLHFHVEKVRSSDQVGEVNGLYATESGDGGLLPIQVQVVTSDKEDFKLTGSQGDVMKESMVVARTVAQTLFGDKLEALGVDLSKLRTHIHATDTAQSKDGPSAGGAITVCLVSRLFNKPIKHLVAMTGEVDVMGNITAIGGLYSKIQGAKQAGVKTIFYPLQNQKDIDDIRQEDPALLADITVVPVSRIEELIQGTIVGAEEILS